MPREQSLGLYLTQAYYWDMNAGARAFADRFMAKERRRPILGSFILGGAGGAVFAIIYNRLAPRS